MLQRNTAKSAHLAHAAVLSLHSICCGLPALAVTLAALGVSGVNFGGALAGLHALFHGNEPGILSRSATLVALGGLMKLSPRRAHPCRGVPWLFVMLAFCCV